MEKDLRNTLRNVVTQCRKQLEQAIIETLQGHFGIHPTGAVEDAARLSHLTAEDSGYRERIVVHLNHIQAAGLKSKDAVAQLVREAAFTHLNRLCAYKLMATRGLIDDPVGKVLKSRGFMFYLADHPEDERLHSGGEQARAYRNYLEWLNGTLAQELEALFSAQDLASGLFPPHRVLESVLAAFNSEELKEIWTEDETIGWVYQYFTPKELRDQARDPKRGGSAAPRNSYELAFRNQFFTPRYVVEFLTDNTLGRTWYEMRKGDTALTTSCRYLVHRPNEIFLASGEAGPETSTPAEDPSKEELLKQPVYIPHRAKKDPREIKVLDPACGSGHFLLYCFDLFQTIYEEAYEDAELGVRLKSDYPDAVEFRRNIPVLILAHNLHGIDIDLRATQIAALALWLRAQRAWHDAKLKRAERPPVQSLHVVCAEPMPGEQELLDEFVAELQPRLLGQLVRMVFEKMKLAGEAGSLLRIEDEISEPIAQAKKEWQAQPELEQRSLFDGARTKARQQSLFDVRSVTDAQFWDDAEAKVIDALREYASRATNGHGILRRLFANDALQGFAFVDLCRQKFDVVLMNPPFGDASKLSLGILDSQLSCSGRDIGSAFVNAATRRWAPDGIVGFLLSTAPWFKPTFTQWRQENLLGPEWTMNVAAHLGGDVLDEATVSASAVVLVRHGHYQTPIIRLLRKMEKEAALLHSLVSLRQNELDENSYFVNLSKISELHGSPLAYWISDGFRKRLGSLPHFEGRCGTVKQGIATADEFRFARAWWEVMPANKWMPYTKTSEYSPYWDDVTWLLNFEHNGQEIRDTGRARVQGVEYFGKAGVTYPGKSVLGFNPRAHPSNSAFGHTGSVVFGFSEHPVVILGYLSSRPVEYVLSLYVGSLQGEAGYHPNHYEVGTIQRLPWPSFSSEEIKFLTDGTSKILGLACKLFDSDETAHHFIIPVGVRSQNLLTDVIENHKMECDLVSAVSDIRNSMDEVVAKALGFSKDDLEEMKYEFALRVPPASGKWRPYFGAEPDEIDPTSVASAILSYVIGCTFGRWDVRFATGERATLELPDPFAPLPVCAPGALQGENGLPLSETPPRYPLRIDWDGILTDDPEHPADIVRRVRDVFELLWGERAEAIEREACELLGVSALRDYFRKPTAGGFWHDHIKRYSKSRRKAPIYWLLQSSKKNYGLWLYYHRLDNDLLFKALLNYVKPKLRLEENKLEQLRVQRTIVGAVGREAKQIEKQLDRQEVLMSELHDFHDKLERAAKLGLEPDLNDGVVLNMAPLWELVPWAEAKKYWEELKDGKYEWSAIGKQMREKGLVK